MMTRLAALFFFLTVAIQTYAQIPVKTLSYKKQPVGKTAYFNTGAVGHLDIPVSILDGARITGMGGLYFYLKDKSYFSVETLMDSKAGFKGADMRTWPEYLFGLKNQGNEPKAYIEDLIKSKDIVLKKQVNPYEVRVFKTKEGKGYWAIGKNRSSLIFTHNEIKDQILWIFTTDLSEDQILKWIINGAL